MQYAVLKHVTIKNDDMFGDIYSLQTAFLRALFYGFWYATEEVLLGEVDGQPACRDEFQPVGRGRIVWLFDFYNWHLCLELWVNVVALLFYYSASANCRLKTIQIEFS